MSASQTVSALKLLAPAKINLTLEVTGVESNGYHTLDTLFAWLDLHDTLELQGAEQTVLEVVSDGVDTSSVTDDEENLVLKALRLLEERAGRPLPSRLRLTKRIPSGGGLGGGSADAAAALVGLRTLHNLPLTDDDLHSLAARLGADVAFGLQGGFARGRHYGEQLEPLPLPSDLKARSLILVAPGFACPTPSVYRAWDQTPSQSAGGASTRFLHSTPEQRLSHIINDLQPAAESLFPQLVEIRQAMTLAGLEAVTLSGSGSTLFGFVPQEGSPESFQKSLSGLGKVTLTHLREDRRIGKFS